MEYIEIEGGRQLSGEIVLSGSKNSALPILACSLLSDKPINLTNVPDLLDIKSMISLIESLGVKVKKKKITIFYRQKIYYLMRLIII